MPMPRPRRRSARSSAYAAVQRLSRDSRSGGRSQPRGADAAASSHRPRAARARHSCARRKTDCDDGCRSARARALARGERLHAASRSSRALQSRDPRCRRPAEAAALRRIASPRAVQAARHRRERRARSHDSRHRPDPGVGRRADREHRRGRRKRVLRRDRHRQRAHPLPGRLRRQHDGESHQS